MDRAEKIDCPYGAEDCPKVNELKKELKALNWKLNVLVAVVLVMHGAELAAVMA